MVAALVSKSHLRQGFATPSRTQSVVPRSKDACMGVGDCGTEKTAASPKIDIASHAFRPSRTEAG